MKNPHIPDKLPLGKLDFNRFIRLIGDSRAELARFDGILQGILNPGLLLSPLVTQEAVQSSRIEGTQTTLEEVLKFEAVPSRKNPKFEEIEEVLNYRKALKYGADSLMERNFSLFMLKEMHSILLDGVRGQNKDRGNFRNIQVYIGTKGQKIEEARFIPPEPFLVPEYMGNFAEYYNSDDEIDYLVQMAIIHAQFEIIHPFNDGNGRLGRMLIPLFLYEKKLLSSPMFYISAYFEKYRDNYTGKLNDITEKNEWEGWIEFFLSAIIEQARQNNRKAREIIDLYNEKKERIFVSTASKHTIRILDALFTKPIFTPSEFTEMTRIPRASTGRILEILEKDGIIETIFKGQGRKSAVIIFPKLLMITER